MGGKDGVARVCPRCNEKKLRWVNVSVGQPKALWVCADCVTPEEYKKIYQER